LALQGAVLRQPEQGQGRDSLQQLIVARKRQTEARARRSVSHCRLTSGSSIAGRYRERAERARAHRRVAERIRAIHEAHRGVYGAPRIHADLRMAHDIHIGPSASSG